LFENRGSTGIFVPKGSGFKAETTEILSYFEDFQHRNRPFGAKRRCLRFFKQALALTGPKILAHPAISIMITGSKKGARAAGYQEMHSPSKLSRKSCRNPGAKAIPEETHAPGKLTNPEPGKLGIGKAAVFLCRCFFHLNRHAIENTHKKR